MVLVQKWPFFQLFFLGNIGQENVFYDILERENAFLGYKNKKFKKWKNWHFSERGNPSFWSKNAHFSTFSFWGNIGHEIFLYDILEWKHAFLGSKNKKFKQSKNWHFSKGVPRSSKGRIINIFTKGLTNGFGPKLAHFPTFFFGNICQQNVFYNILERKNTLLGYKNKKFKK